jgi:hypothetical protein
MIGRIDEEKVKASRQIALTGDADIRAGPGAPVA